MVPPAEVVEHLEEFLAPRREAADFRWSSADQWHLTVAFLADVPERVLDELEERLTSAAERRTPIRLRVAGGGAFPDPARAKVLWAGLEGDLDELGRLAAGARAAAVKSGAEVDGTRFRAHLTLARLGARREVSNWVRLLDGYAGPEWLADELTLVQSHLGEGQRGRPRHEVLGVFGIGADPALRSL